MRRSGWPDGWAQPLSPQPSVPNGHAHDPLTPMDLRPRAGLCLVILGGGGLNWPPGILADPPTHPPTLENFSSEKNEIYQRGPNLEVDFRYTNFFLASDPPPPV